MKNTARVKNGQLSTTVTNFSGFAYGVSIPPGSNAISVPFTRISVVLAAVTEVSTGQVPHVGRAQVSVMNVAPGSGSVVVRVTGSSNSVVRGELMTTVGSLFRQGRSLCQYILRSSRIFRR